MAYSRAKSHSLRGSSRYGKKKRGGVRRRFAVKKRTYRKKASTRLSKRRILDMTSIKKRDVLVPTTNATLDPLLPSEALPAILGSGRPTPPRTPAYTYVLPWIPTYRQPTTVGNTNTTKNNMTTGNPYYKGLSENITISVTGGIPWQWRRICFTYKGNSLVRTFEYPTGGTGSPNATFAPLSFYKNTFDSETGIFRPLYDIASYYGETGGPTTSTPRALQVLYQTLFQGSTSQFRDDVVNTDWINVMTAKTDNSEVNIKYDKTVTISSGNEEGVQRNYKRYHPMNKTVNYESFEFGNDTTYQPFSTSSKPGMGDYYVIDFFQARYGSDADSGNLIFDPRATMYWHEK